MLIYHFCAWPPDCIELLQSLHILSSVMSTVGFLEEMLHQEGLIIFLEIKQILTEWQRVQITRHHLIKLLQQIKLIQDSQQNWTVKPSTVVTHQNWSAEAFKEGDERIKSFC